MISTLRASSGRTDGNGLAEGTLGEEKVGENAGEETILMNGGPAKRLYSDRAHTYIAPTGRCWPDWLTKSSSTCMADAHCQDDEGYHLPPFRLTLDFWSQLGRASTVSRRITEFSSGLLHRR